MLRGKITKLTTNVGGGTLVLLDSPNLSAIAISVTVEAALLTAFATGAKVELDTFDNSNIIKRINAFDVNRQARPNQISRLATQMNSGLNILEVFIIQSNAIEEKVFKASDFSIQQICHSAALTKEIFNFSESDGEIVSASLSNVPGD